MRFRIYLFYDKVNFYIQIRKINIKLLLMLRYSVKSPVYTVVGAYMCFLDFSAILF